MAVRGYSGAQIGLHWGAAVLVAVAFVNHEAMIAAAEAAEKGGPAVLAGGALAHVVAGALLLPLALARLFLRARRGAPPPPEGEHPALRFLARAVHATLYALMILLPLTGAAAWFGGVGAAAALHVLMKPLLLAALALHVAGALAHGFLFQTGVLERMFRPERE